MSPTEGPFGSPEVQNLLAREEGQFLEFKSLWDLSGATRKVLDRKDVRNFIAECVAAFANADGGVLLLGVDDDGSVSGHGYPEDVVEEFALVAERRLRPAVRCSVARVKLDGHEVIVFEVPMSPEAVMFEGDGFPYRVADMVRREPQEVINQRKQAYRTVGYEPRVRHEASVADLDLKLARSFLAKSVHAGREIEELLVRLGLLAQGPRGLLVTNAALLLFAREPALRWHPKAGIRFFRVDGAERLHGTQRNVAQLERFDPPLARALPQALKFAATQVRRSEKLHDLFFRETPEYPEFAWQEAIVNAIAHRDYEVTGLETEVWFYADRMEVKSPGELVPPVTLEALRSRAPAHASRNPLLVRTLVEAGVMRDEGEGIPRMFDEMSQSFLRAPKFDFAHGCFAVTLSNQPVFDGPSAEWQHVVEKLGLRLTQKRVLLARPQSFTSRDYQDLNQLDRDDAYREIQELVQAGVVAAPEVKGKGAKYVVDPTLVARRTYLESRGVELRRYFASHDELSNAKYRELFGVTRYVAARELKELVREGWLRLEGERRGAVYCRERGLGSERAERGP
jgi:ATP-dependent DNA helicase RecG